MSDSKNSSDDGISSSVRSSRLDFHLNTVDIDVGAEDNRVIDDINRNKLSTDRLHTEPGLNKLKWDKKSREKVKELGLRIKKGPFTAKEDSILLRNWRSLCDDFPIDSPHVVLGFYGYHYLTDPSDRRAAKQLIVKSQMYLRLAKDLPNRTLHQIYQRARKAFSGLNKAGNLSKEEQQSIIKLGQKKVRKVEIATKFFADIRAVNDIIKKNVSDTGRLLKKNRWDPEEDQRFVKVIRKLMKIKGITDYEEIPWHLVAHQMVERNDIQCRNHFWSNTFYKMYDPEFGLIGKRWKKKDYRRLIYFLYKSDYRSEREIDWDFIKQRFPQFSHFFVLIYFFKPLI